MTYYFIDFENVHETGLKGVETLPAEDRVHLFYTVNANKISWEFFEICRSSNILLHKVAAGKQALDMMLSSFLGNIVASDPGARFVIISRDRDYDPVVDFWNMAEPPVAVSRFTSIAAACGAPAEKDEPAEQPEQPERRRATPSRSRKNGRFVRSSGAATPKERAETAAPAAETPAGTATVAAAEEAAPVEEEKIAETVLEAAEQKTEPAKKPVRRGGRGRSAKPRTEKPAEPVNAEPAEPEKIEEPAPAENAEPAKKEPAKAEKKEKPVAAARRNGPESNAVHNAVQKVLAQEKIESATIAFLASLTAKNWGKENDKQLIYRAVIKQYGQKEGLRLYGIMKPCLKG